jgi:DNA-binding MarR family transcriptional regulator
MTSSLPNPRQDRLKILEQLIALSVDLHNLNAGVQRRWSLSIVQWLILKKIIEMPGLSARTIAEISKVHPSTLTPTINRLEGLGLIHILERPSDNRRKFLIASWKGLEWSRRSELALKEALEVSLNQDDLESTGLETTRNLTANLNRWIFAGHGSAGVTN